MEIDLNSFDFFILSFNCLNLLSLSAFKTIIFSLSFWTSFLSLRFSWVNCFGTNDVAFSLFTCSLCFLRPIGYRRSLLIISFVLFKFYGPSLFLLLLNYLWVLFLGLFDFAIDLFAQKVGDMHSTTEPVGLLLPV